MFTEIPNMDKGIQAITVAEKAETFWQMKCEDKHDCDNIWFMCVYQAILGYFFYFMMQCSAYWQSIKSIFWLILWFFFYIVQNPWWFNAQVFVVPKPIMQLPLGI